MIEIRCVYGKGRNKKIRRRCIHGSDVLEIFETDDGKAIIRLARTEHKYRCWVETDESFDDVKKKIGMKEAMKEAISLENIEVTQLDKLSEGVQYRLLELYEKTGVPYVVKDSILIEYKKH